ncbi:MAG: endonuclease/exonuclease/phosphatase family protein [Alphaproteobacteria bacterium]
MTLILSWNIQNGIGADGVMSLERIAAVIKAMGEPDVICLQEISRHLALFEGGAAADQIAEISALFSGYTVIFGAAIEAAHDGAAHDGADPRWQYGNATLTRLPVLSVFRHALPQPADGGVKHMARQATEITVATAQGALRVVNTHLEFHAAKQRRAQIERLRDIHHEIASSMRAPPKNDTAGPYQALARPEDCVMCGDFNMETDFDEYGAMLAPLAEGAAPFHDAWRIVHPERPHDPTCGVHDHNQWPQGPHCRDFFFVTDKIARVAQDVIVDTKTNASDHQPLMLRLAEA